MEDSITIRHGLSCFSVTSEPELVTTKTGKEVYVTRGTSTAPGPGSCPRCGNAMHRHGKMEMKVQDIDLLGHLHIIIVTYDRYRCSCGSCGHTQMQEVAFREPGHFITERLGRRIRIRLNCGAGISETARSLSVHPSIIYGIDKANLKAILDGRKPPVCECIGIDGFKLHKGHRYATVVTDLKAGLVLFLEEGKAKEQAYHFFAEMGDAWMGHVKAVSMDMNAQYDSAFRERWPGIRIVYDHFYLVRMYNDTVLTAIRRRKQREMLEGGNEEGYTLLKNSRYLLLSRMDTLRERDREAHENNVRLRRLYLDRGRPIPPGERIRKPYRERRPKDILAANEDLSVCYLLLEQFNLAYGVASITKLYKGMKSWMRLARQSKVPELLSFCDTVQRHLMGIVYHAKFPISSGKVEGVNNMIKTIRRKAYGFRDTEYFFLKIKFASLRGPYRYKSHTIL